MTASKKESLDLRDIALDPRVLRHVEHASSHMDIIHRKPFFPPGLEPESIETEALVDCAPQELFDYVTTPALWHTWHPATRSVVDVPMRPLVTGERMLEKARVGPRRLEIIWFVALCKPPSQWVIVAEDPTGVVRITYTIEEHTTGSQFKRVLEYHSKGPMRVFDSNVLRWMLRAQSRRALDDLKSLFEKRGPRPAQESIW